ncbi:MAG: hypothetical protein AAGH46_11605, partial [Bacteroidota bacterium]
MALGISYIYHQAMKKPLLLLSLIISLSGTYLWGQKTNKANLFAGERESATSEVIAEDYYKRGQFRKALLSYEKLLAEKPYSFKFLYKIIDIRALGP